VNGPEHFRRAEALLRSCTIGEPDIDSEGVVVPTYPATEYDEVLGREVNSVGNALLAAQVHATLAVAAATAHDAKRAGGEWSAVLA